MSTQAETTRSPRPGGPKARRGGGIQGRQTTAGWLFIAPVVVLLGLFLFVPVLMAAWVSVSDWAGRGSPFSSGVEFVGVDNYSRILTGGGLDTQDFGTALRNNVYYVALVVPLQTALSLFLAVLVTRRILRARGFFRTAFYFPSVTSSVAITVLWLFLFNANGVINKILSWISIDGPNWFADPRGVIHVLLSVVGIDRAPEPMLAGEILGISYWEWVAGPSVAMSAFILMAIFTTSGTFMLLFIAALQAIGPEIEEAALIDRANSWQRFRYVTLPMVKPTLFTVLTLGLIGSWQVFDQIYTGTQGGPAKTTVTPAYLSFNAAFNQNDWGEGAAIAFILFAIIVVFTVLQRWILREKDRSGRRRRKLSRRRPVQHLAVEKER